MLDAENPADNAAENSAAEGAATTTAPAAEPAQAPATEAPAADPPVKKATSKRAAAKKATTKKATSSTTKRATKKSAPQDQAATVPAGEDARAKTETSAPAKKAGRSASGAKKTTAKRTSKKVAQVPATGTPPAETASVLAPGASAEADLPTDDASTPPAPMLLFQPPEPTKAPSRRKSAEPRPDAESDTERSEGDEPTTQPQNRQPATTQGGSQNQGQKQGTASRTEDGETRDDKASESDESHGPEPDEDADGEGGNRRRRRRGGRRRRKPGENDVDGSDAGNKETGSRDTGKREQAGGDAGDADEGSDAEGSTGTRRRRRRRRTGDDGGDTGKDDPDNTVTRVRKPRAAEDEITSLTGSTRLEAKKQRRREGREAGRRRAPIVSEAEFLARREAVERVMVIRQKEDLTQIAVLEDKVLVEHYVARESQTSLIGNVYIGRVQNVLPSMEAAFIDIGKGRNAVIYAGEVNWDAFGAKGGQQRKIESVLKSGQSVLVQVSKDPVGHKGGRLTSQISIPGRFLVYVPDGTTSGISRKLPDTERTRLKTLLKEIVPDTAGVIVRTAAEGASEEELTRDVERLTARWDDIQSKVAGGTAPQLLYGEPDLTLKVVRDLFTEDFAKLVISGADAWDVVDGYVEHVAPDLADRLEKYDGGRDVFAEYRIDEQIAKGLDRKVWLPSGGSLVIDRTEAMTVVDVNTGKFTGSGGNLEETVTRNNLEAAEEFVRQLRLRDIGGIIVVDFIDMVLESNRDLVLRRMVECLGRDRTRHQVAEVTSLGLVQMTRKRIGTGLLEAFSEGCEQCQGRGLMVQHEPVEPKNKNGDEPRRNRRSGRDRGRGADNRGNGSSASSTPTPKDVAAVAKPENADKPPLDEIEEPAAGVVPPDARREEIDQPGAVQAEPSLAGDREDAFSSSRSTSAAAADTQQPARQRKRSARREQGPAASTTVDPPAPPTQPSAPAPEAHENDVAPAETGSARIVTSVRRRSASRPAGPPVAVDAGVSGGDAPDGVGAEPGSEDHAPAASQAHVPVKKKGSRKR